MRHDPFKRGQLHYFVTVAEEGQITLAAAKLHMAQPALSQAIGQLETDLGFRLFERHARGVTLTSAGEKFYEKAQRAVLAATEAIQTARSLERAESGTIEFGFVGSPPGLDSPGPLEAFARAHPRIDICYRELPFPSMPTTSWMVEVDLAVSAQPPADPNIWSHVLRREPRVVLTSSRHALARRDMLTVAEVIDEAFIGLHPSIEPAWAGFWSLDDHRGGPPRRVTADRAGNPQEVLASLAVRRAITTVPASVAALTTKVLPGLAAIPLRDAELAVIMLLGHEDRRNRLVQTFVAFARSVSSTGAADQLPAGGGAG